MSTTTTLSPPSPVVRGGAGGKHDHSPNIISHNAMADVKSKIEKLASELKQQRCRQSSNNIRPILSHLNTDSITTTSKSPKRPTLSPFSRTKSHQLQQHGYHPSTPHPGFGSGGSIPGLEPTSRSLSDLHNERSYLLYNLQTQGERATRLYQRYAHLEAKKETLKAASSSSPCASSGENNIATGGVSTAAKKKKIKKDLSLLRSRIAGSTQQEQLIMLRLGEIHVELVNRGRWVMTHQHQNQCQQQQQIVYGPMSAVVEGQGYFQNQWQQHHQGHGYGQVPATPMSADSYSNSPVGENGGEYLYTPSVLSPLSPSFVPGGGVSFFGDIWSRPSQCQQEEAQDQPAPETQEQHLAPPTAPEHAPEQEPEEPHRPIDVEEDEDQTPKPKNDLEAVPLSAVTSKFTTPIKFTPTTPNTTTSTVSTSTLPSEHLATPINPGRIPWDEYPSDSEDDGSFDSFDGSSFTPIGVVVNNPFCAVSSSLVHGTNASSNSGSGSGSGVMVSEHELESEDPQEQYRAQAEEDEKDEEGGEGSDDSASEPGDLLSEHQRRNASFSQGGDDGEEEEGEPTVSWKRSNRRLSMPTSLKNI